MSESSIERLRNLILRRNQMVFDYSEMGRRCHLDRYLINHGIPTERLKEMLSEEEIREICEICEDHSCHSYKRISKPNGLNEKGEANRGLERIRVESIC